MFRFSRILALAALAPLAGMPPAPVRAALPGSTSVVFEAPANHSPAGPTSPGDPFGRVLPSGRIVHPIGANVVVGMDAEGLALSPSGRYAVVSNDDPLQRDAISALDSATQGGPSLAVVDTLTMTVVSRYADPSVAFFAGVVALRDPAAPENTLVFASGGRSNAVYVFDLDAAGVVSPDTVHPKIDVAGTPGTLVANATGTTLYAIDTFGDDVAALDVASRTLAPARIPAGFAPLGAAMSAGGLLVANEGLGSYHAVPPAAVPPFGTVAPDLTHASSLMLVPANADGSLAASVSATVPLDRTPDGLDIVGGAQPAAIAAMRTKPYAFVAMANVDRIATVALAGGTPRVAGGTELRLFDRGPYGTQPVALVLAPGERRLYVALTGIDAIAVLDTRDPLHLHRLGLIPTGWAPSALALSNDGRYLFVTNAKGIGHDAGFTGDRAIAIDPIGRIQSISEDASAEWSTLERVDLSRVDLRRSTPLALSYLRTIVGGRKNALVPQRFGSAGSTAIKHVVDIVMPGATYDALLGDLTDVVGTPYGSGDPRYDAYDARVTPNLHALARTYALAANFFTEADRAELDSVMALEGIASSVAQKSALGRQTEDPDDATRNGSIFASLARRGATYRDYGGFLRLSDFDDGTAADPRADDPQYSGPGDVIAPTQGLGGLYSSDVPAPLALAGRVDLNYPGYNVRIRDVRRAAEFVRDFDAYARSGSMPAFAYVWLPPTREAATSDATALEEATADADRALGIIVDEITHGPQWSSTAIFIFPGDSLGTRDHVDPSRTYALVVSPYAKRHYASKLHLSTASVLKTEEEVLGLPALSLGDALAGDLSDFFTSIPNVEPDPRADPTLPAGAPSAPP